MEVRSETGMISLGVSPPIPSMRLAYAADGTAVYKPVPAVSPPPPPPPFGVGVGVSGGGGGAAPGLVAAVTGSTVTPAAPIAESNSNLVPMTSPGLNLSSGESLKRKRGRPRKYGPDGTMARALVMVPAGASPVSGAFSPTSPPGTGGSPFSHSRPASVMKKPMGRPPGSGKKQQMAALGSAGIGFTPHVITVLAGEAPNMISQTHRDSYDFLVSIVDPFKRLKVDDYEALLVSALNAISGAVFKVDAHFHVVLLSNIFEMSFWKYGPTARKALQELVTCLAAVPDKFLDGCLHMLVSNFLPPRNLREATSGETWLAVKNEVQSQVHRTLHDIAELVPLAPVKLKDVIDRRMPKHTDPKEVILMFVECMLQLKNDEIWESVGSIFLAKVVDLLTDLDVNISWEDIQKEDHNKGIFHMDLENAQENVDGYEEFDSKVPQENGAFKGNAFADKLDGLMVIMCEHLKSCAFDGSLVKVFETLLDSFRRTLMNAYKSKFAQFIMFYACSLDPDKNGVLFADFLTTSFVSKSVDSLTRMSAVAYLASFLSRAKFISTDIVASNLKRLADWCYEYCQYHDGQGILFNLRAHRVFYSGCQAVMYILCFRMRSMMSIPELKSLLFNLHLEPILHHSLEPLKVCLPTIVREFHRQASAAHLFTSKYFRDEQMMESEFSKAFGGSERLDMFFPFDPYLLKESDRFMRPNFEFWYMVRRTYSDFSSEHEDGDDDGGYISDDVEFSDHENADDGIEEDDLDFSMNKMSITPKPSSRYQTMAGKLNIPARMPARLSPSLSP